MKNLIKSLQHVALHVSNVQNSIHFYKNILEFEQLSTRPNFDFDGAWFSLGETRELHLLEGLNYEVKSASRGTHFAIEVHSIKSIEQFLSSKSIVFKGPKTRPDGVWQIFISDPDGHVIEFTELIAGFNLQTPLSV